MELIHGVVNDGTHKELILEKMDSFIEKSNTLKKHFAHKEYFEHSDQEFKNKVLFNTPAFLSVLGEDYFMSEINEYYVQLLKDKDNSVRSRVARDFYRMIEEFGTIASYR